MKRFNTSLLVATTAFASVVVLASSASASRTTLSAMSTPYPSPTNTIPKGVHQVRKPGIGAAASAAPTLTSATSDAAAKQSYGTVRRDSSIAHLASPPLPSVIQKTHPASALVSGHTRAERQRTIAKVPALRLDSSNSAAPTIGGPVKAALLDPWGGCGEYAPGWSDLKSHWSSYGTTPLMIDTTTFCYTYSNPITYSALVADDPQVLVLSDPAGGLYQFTSGEIAAITKYVKAGHNLVGTYLTFGWRTLSNSALASLFGLASNFSSSSPAVTPDYRVKYPVWPLFRRVPNPYDSDGYPYSQVPASGIWGSGALQKAKYVAETKCDLAAITSYATDTYQATYIANMPEYTPGTADLQFLYNALTQTSK